MKEFFKKTKTYLGEVKGEAKRVTWPGKRELYDSTVVVISFIVILALTTLVYDWVIEKAIEVVHWGVMEGSVQ